MTIVSTLFEQLAARIPDKARAQELLADAIKGDPLVAKNEQRVAKAAVLDSEDAIELRLNGLLDDVSLLNDTLEKMRAPLELDTNADDLLDKTHVWKMRTNAVTVDLRHEDKRLMRFKVTRAKTGGYNIEAEQKLGGGTMSIDMYNNKHVTTFAEVEKELGEHLESAFNVPANEAEFVLNKLAQTIDCRPAQFLEVIKNEQFDDVLRFVQNGINVEHAYTEYEAAFRALDFVLMSRHDKHHQKGPEAFTDQQRRQLFDAVVAQAKDPARLLSKTTMYQAASHNCTALVPLLVELGCPVTDRDFLEAPSVAMLKVLRPYASDINCGTSNAGHRAASRGDYASFLWLEEQGLSKEARVEHNFPTYAHAVATATRRKENIAAGGKDAWPEFLQHLIDHGYPFDAPGRAGTPLACAVRRGQFDLAQILIDAGAKTTPSLMADVISGIYCEEFSLEQGLNFMTFLHDQHAVPYTQDAAEKVFSTIKGASTYSFFEADWKKLKPLADIADFLAAQGAKPKETPELAQLRATCAVKLRDADPAALQSLGIDVLPAPQATPRIRRPSQ